MTRTRFVAAIAALFGMRAAAQKSNSTGCIYSEEKHTITCGGAGWTSIEFPPLRNGQCPVCRVQAPPTKGVFVGLRADKDGNFTDAYGGVVLIRCAGSPGHPCNNAFYQDAEKE